MPSTMRNVMYSQARGTDRNKKVPPEQAATHWNGLRDDSVYDQSAANKRRGTSVYGGEVDNDARSIIEFEPLFARSSETYIDGDSLDESSLPVFSVFNGFGFMRRPQDAMLALARETARLAIIGFARANANSEKTDMQDTSDSFSVQVGGVAFVRVTGTELIPAGAFVMILPPNPLLPLSHFEKVHEQEWGNLSRRRYVGQVMPYDGTLHSMTMDSVVAGAHAYIAQDNSIDNDEWDRGLLLGGKATVEAATLMFAISATILGSAGYAGPRAVAGTADATNFMTVLDGVRANRALQKKIVDHMFARSADSLFGKPQGGNAITGEAIRANRAQGEALYNLFSAYLSIDMTYRRFCVGRCLDTGMPGDYIPIMVGANTV